MIERGRTVVDRLQGGKTALFLHDWSLSHVQTSVFTQYWPSAVPKSRNSGPLRKLKTNLARQQRALKRYVSSRYYPSSAYSDMRVATANNENVVINSILLTFVLAYAFAVTAFDIALLFLNTAYDLAVVTGMDMGIILLIVAGVLASLSGWLLAFLMNLVTLSIHDGANRKRKARTVQTVRTALKDAGVVSLSWMGLAARVLSPLLLSAISGVLYIKYGLSQFTLPVYVWAAGAISLLGISLWQLTTYGLAPYAVLLEHLPVSQAMARSRNLLQRRGRLFLFSIYTAFVINIAAFSTLAAIAKQSIGNMAFLVLAVVVIATMMLANGILTTFYRKRKLARKH